MALKPMPRQLGDFVELQRGNTYRGKLKGLPGPFLLGLASIERNGGFRSDKLVTYGGESPQKMLVFPGDLYVSLKDVTQSADLLGAVARVPPYIPSGRMTQDTVKLVFKAGFEDQSTQKLIYWVLRTPQYRAYCRSRATGTTNLGLSREDFLCFPIPPYTRDRESIVELLEALSDKVELNRRMSETLESMARAIFKSWFVDFDPVRAKMDGRQPERMSPEIAALFPTQLTHESGELIPHGWRYVSVSDVVEGVYDGPHATPPKADQGHVFLGIKNLTGTRVDLGSIRYISEEDWPRWTKRIEPRHGDIVFTYEATLGYFAIIPPKLKCCLGRRLALVRPRTEALDSHFLFHAFTADPFLSYLERHSIHGATVNRVPLKEFPQYPLLCPSTSLISGFEKLAAPIWDKIHCNDAESVVLSNIRDTLLPKLLSGELRVPQAEKMVSEAL